MKAKNNKTKSLKITKQVRRLIEKQLDQPFVVNINGRKRLFR
jgi:hypothetical protein